MWTPIQYRVDTYTGISITGKLFCFTLFLMCFSPVAILLSFETSHHTVITERKKDFLTFPFCSDDVRSHTCNHLSIIISLFFFAFFFLIRSSSSYSSVIQVFFQALTLICCSWRKKKTWGAAFCSQTVQWAPRVCFSNSCLYPNRLQQWSRCVIDSLPQSLSIFFLNLI